MSTKKKQEKHEGVADNYPPICETLNLPLARVTFNDLVISYTAKNDEGNLTKQTVQKTYDSRHAVKVIYGRLKGDKGRYLLLLMQKISNEQTAERLKTFA